MNSMGWKIAVLVLGILLIGSAAVADTTVAGGPETAAIDPALADGAQDAAMPSLTESVLPSLGRIAVSLVVIIIFIYAVVFLLRKLSGNRLGGTRKGKTIQVIEQAYLAPKKSVCLLKMADRAVLIGITDSTINMLTECEWDAIPQNDLPSKKAGQTGFSGFLSEATNRLFKARKEQAGSVS